MEVAAEAVERFAAHLDALTPEDEAIGVAVSGGPDSLALLLLAAAAFPGRVEAATIDLLEGAHSMMSTFSALTRPSRCAAASTGNTSPTIDVRGPTASAARTRQAASRLDTPNAEVSTRRIDP